MSESISQRLGMNVQEISVQNGRFYHGSPVQGITRFTKAEEATLGDGLYAVSTSVQAAAYARIRGDMVTGMPTVYTVGVETAKLVDLDDQDTLTTVIGGFRKILIHRIQQADNMWYVQNSRAKIVEDIDRGITVGQVKYAAHRESALFAGYLSALGFDGLKAWEAGEGGDSPGATGAHETYVFFDPQSVQILDEQAVLPPEPIINLLDRYRNSSRS